MVQGKQATRNPLPVNQTLLPCFFKVQQQSATCYSIEESRNTGGGFTLTHNRIQKTAAAAAAAGNYISNKKLARFLHLLVHFLLDAEPVAATAAGIRGSTGAPFAFPLNIMPPPPPPPLRPPPPPPP